MTDVDPATVDSEELAAFRAYQESHKSPEAAALLDAGAAPFTPDADAMLKQIQALQARVDSMLAAQGIPSDPVEAAVMNLRAHVEARANATPQHDFTSVHEALKGLSEPPTRDQTEVVRLAVDKLHKQVGRQAETEYLTELASDLHEAVLKVK